MPSGSVDRRSSAVRASTGAFGPSPVMSAGPASVSRLGLVRRWSSMTCPWPGDEDREQDERAGQERKRAGTSLNFELMPSPPLAVQASRPRRQSTLDDEVGWGEWTGGRLANRHCIPTMTWPAAPHRHRHRLRLQQAEAACVCQVRAGDQPEAELVFFRELVTRTCGHLAGTLAHRPCGLTAFPADEPVHPSRSTVGQWGQWRLQPGTRDVRAVSNRQGASDKPMRAGRTGSALASPG